jgi:hypothetical protein
MSRQLLNCRSISSLFKLSAFSKFSLAVFDGVIYNSATNIFSGFLLKSANCLPMISIINQNRAKL